MLIVFDVSNIYYLPQFLPVIKAFLERKHQVILVCHRNNISNKYDAELDGAGVQSTWVADDKESLMLFNQLKPHWIFFANEYKYVTQLPLNTRTAQLGHGIGPKPSYYHKSSTPMTVRFMEGELRLKKIKGLYPEGEFVQVGYSKLDPIVNGKEVGVSLSEKGLDVNSKTILYAPTFNPSSLECFPDNWPELFSEYNILIKPHTFTYTIEQYAGQRKKLERWNKYSNVYVAGELELSLVPFMKTADILLSEASSSLFEFAALDKPVVVCDFFKLKWSYRGPFHYRFIKRFGKDSVLYEGLGLHVKRFKELLKAVPHQLANPGQYSESRHCFTRGHVGLMDGNASLRIVQWVESRSLAVCGS